MAVNIHITIIELNALHTKRQNLFQELDAVIHLLMEAKHWGLRKSRNATSLNSRFKSLDTLKVKIISVTFRRVIISIKLRKCSSKIITSILSFISGRLATKSNQIKQLIRNGRSASLQRTFKKSFTSFSHSTRNKTRDGLIRVRNIRALNGRFNTSI